jgi:hypothetical protein
MTEIMLLASIQAVQGEIMEKDKCLFANQAVTSLALPVLKAHSKAILHIPLSYNIYPICLCIDYCCLQLSLPRPFLFFFSSDADLR